MLENKRLEHYREKEERMDLEAGKFMVFCQ